MRRGNTERMEEEGEGKRNGGRKLGEEKDGGGSRMEEGRKERKMEENFSETVHTRKESNMAQFEKFLPEYDKVMNDCNETNCCK